MEIGEPKRDVTYEPLEDPFREPAPAEPAPAPQREAEPEKVPA